MSKYAVLLLLIFIVGAVVIGPLIADGFAFGEADTRLINIEKTLSQKYTVLSGGFLVAQNSPYFEPKLEDLPESMESLNASKAGMVIITAYSSSPDETDDTPFITASGNRVKYGVVAANFLPFGTLIKLPKIFGDKIFIVEDRLHSRYNDRVDVWLPTKWDALQFGQKLSEIEIL